MYVFPLFLTPANVTFMSQINRTGDMEGVGYHKGTDASSKDNAYRNHSKFIGGHGQRVSSIAMTYILYSFDLRNKNQRF